jgi:hypothetical protein
LTQEIEVRVHHARVGDGGNSIEAARPVGSRRAVARLFDGPRVVIGEVDARWIGGVLGFDVGSQIFQRVLGRPLADGKAIEEDDVRRNAPGDGEEQPLRIAGLVLGPARRRADDVFRMELFEAVDRAVDVVPDEPSREKDDVLAAVALFGAVSPGHPPSKGQRNEREKRNRAAGGEPLHEVSILPCRLEAPQCLSQV